MLTQGVSTGALSLSSGFAESRAYGLAVFLTNSSVFSALSAFSAVKVPSSVETFASFAVNGPHCRDALYQGKPSAGSKNADRERFSQPPNESNS